MSIRETRGRSVGVLRGMPCFPRIDYMRVFCIFRVMRTFYTSGAATNILIEPETGFILPSSFVFSLFLTLSLKTFNSLKVTIL